MSVGVSTFIPFTHDSAVDCDLPFVNFIKSPSVMLLVFMNLGSKCIIGALVLSRMRSTPSLRPRTLSQYFVLGISSGMIRATESYTLNATSRRMHIPSCGGLPGTFDSSSIRYALFTMELLSNIFF